MNADAKKELTQELSELFLVRLALVLIPARRALQFAGREELAAVAGRMVNSLSADLESALSRYEVNGQGEHNEREHL
jgi:hypothetical protein